ncbi:dNTP triphosphohydrolase [Clostridium botulinum]|nr:dNTP triphosphohydrolase [Clostridium botulinum]
MEKTNINELIEFRYNIMKNYKQKPNKECRANELNSDKINGEKYGQLFDRNEFSIDRDRIRFSRAFRRLEHKAQVYTYKKGDHFRTRLTHTLEVTQIATSLARNLNLNEDLVEAISLGHDIGHTPFGHQGERTLDKIMSGDDDLTGKIKYKIGYGGFKHNFHSLKILDLYEVKYENIDGMNLTWQVLEGILKHTKTKRCENDKCKNCGKCWNLNRFTENKELHKRISDYKEQEFSLTLEGQIVAIADEIAQRQHDIDDGLRDVELNLRFNDVAKKLIEEFNKLLEDPKCEDTIYIDNLKDLIDDIEKQIKCNDECNEDKNYRKELFNINSLTRNIINFFIIDVTINSLNLLMKYSKFKENKEQNPKIFEEKLIKFSEVGKKVNEIIEQYINTRILNSYNVNRFDGKAIYIVRQLFKAYYINPRQMPMYVLKRMSKKINHFLKDYKLEIKNDKGKYQKISEIDFITSKKDMVNELIKLLKLELKLNKLNIIDDTKKSEDKKIYEFINEQKTDKTEEEDKLLIVEKLLELHYIYLSTICDYIAGMTDNFATDEFQKLYLV